MDHPSPRDRPQAQRLLDAAFEQGLCFLPELTACAGRALARSAHADLHFAGRSPDSIFGLLSGALAGTTCRD